MDFLHHIGPLRTIRLDVRRAHYNTGPGGYCLHNFAAYIGLASGFHRPWLAHKAQSKVIRRDRLKDGVVGPVMQSS